MRESGINTWTVYVPAADAADALPPRPWDALSRPTVEDLLPGGLALWPRGAAWGTPDGVALDDKSVLAGITRVLLAPFCDLYARAYRITEESRAVTLVDSLADWEADYGLPDADAPASTPTGRRRALLSRVSSIATITPQEFVRLAHLEGFTVAIEEPALFECGFSECGGAHTCGDLRQEVFWVVHVYDLAIDYFSCGESVCGEDPLFDGVAAEHLRRLFSRLAPGWSYPVFVIHDIVPLTLDGLTLTLDGVPLSMSPLTIG